MSGETKFTPGPWRVDDVVVRDDEDGIVADCDRFQYTDDGEIRLPGCEANARLIAAAPDLYEALAMLLHQAIQSDLSSPAHEWGCEAIDAAKAALARARGESLDETRKDG